jgi:hypothetical protein
MELGAELERMAVSEQLKNSGVTPGQMTNFLADAAHDLADRPEVLSGKPIAAHGMSEYDVREQELAPSMLKLKAKLDSSLIPGMTEDNKKRSYFDSADKGSPDLAKEGTLLDSCLLAAVKDQGAATRRWSRY